MKVLVADKLGKGGMDVLKQETGLQVDDRPGLKPEELMTIIADYDAVIVRSGTRLTKPLIEAAAKLRVIGRAGVGVDNVDLEAATKRGIIVMNTPEGNTMSTAEHTFSMLMSLARKIPQAHQSLKGGNWKRNDFLGTELNGKTLGVVGFGRIGREVAKRALAFGMRVLVFDPFIAKDSIKDLPIKISGLNDLLPESDFITVHTPLTPETKYLLNDERLKLCKKGVRIINCARGGIVEEAALLRALESGQVAGAALDVFETEPPPADYPLLKMPQVIVTPHLGAATQEAQENVAVDVARQVIDALYDRAIKNAVNIPNLGPEIMKGLRPWLVLAEKIGMLFPQLFEGRLKSVTVRYGGEVTRYGCAPLTLAVLKGLLSPICSETVNFVNATSMAKERGIGVIESLSTQVEDFSHYIEVEVQQGHDVNRIMGTLFGKEKPRIVRVNEFLVELEPEGNVIFIKNEDQPGVVGTIGSILGKNKINIAEMTLGRVSSGQKMLAMTVINTDNDVPAGVLTEIKKFPPILDAKVVKL